MQKAWLPTIITFHLWRLSSVSAPSTPPCRFALLLQLGVSHRPPICSCLRPPLVLGRLTEGGPWTPQTCWYVMTDPRREGQNQMWTWDVTEGPEPHFFCFFLHLLTINCTYFYVIYLSVRYHSAGWLVARLHSPPGLLSTESAWWCFTWCILSIQISLTRFRPKTFFSWHVVNLTPRIELENRDMQLLYTELCLFCLHFFLFLFTSVWLWFLCLIYICL